MDTSIPIHRRICRLNWLAISDQLDTRGFAVIEGLLSEGECRSVKALYPRDSCFRKRVIMQRHSYGQGEYQYFSYPLPTVVTALRESLYPFLSKVANRWHELMKKELRFPEVHQSYLEQCLHAGQIQPTPLLLKYQAGDYNRLHQDLYGELFFPLQATTLLSRTGEDFTGGEFVLTEQRPRVQSRPQVVSLNQGDTIIFAVRQRPAQGARGIHRVNVRHGVSEVSQGERYTLGVIFHDAT